MARKKKNAGSASLAAPETREEHYLAKIAGLVDTKPEYPFTRLERYLDVIADSSGFSPTEAQLAAMNSGATAEKIAAIEEKVPLVGKGINLLDNWYFPTAINQRGQQNYSFTTPAGYCIDRWKLSQASVTVSTSGLQLNATTAGYGLIQYMESALWDCLAGKEVTISFLLSATADTGEIFVSGSEVSSYRHSAGLISATIILPSAGSDSAKYVSLRASATVIAAKLELGSTQTLARNIGTDANPQWVLNDPAPNYQQELAKCQRYLLVLGGSAYSIVGSTVAETTSRCYVDIPTPVTMRDNPTPSFSGTWSLCDKYSSRSTYASVSSLAKEANSNNTVSIRCDTTTNPMTAGRYYVLQAENDASARIILSAEL